MQTRFGQAGLDLRFYISNKLPLAGVGGGEPMLLPRVWRWGR